MIIAVAISKSLAEKTVIAKVSARERKITYTILIIHSCAQVDGELWDLERPLEKSCKLQLLDFESEEGMALV